MGNVLEGMQSMLSRMRAASGRRSAAPLARRRVPPQAVQEPRQIAAIGGTTAGSYLQVFVFINIL
ncbi:MAG: hypothetical protein KIT13_02600 [Burkholderiales bacterium]|nr:hypothetical protein [Burkholderiales bacterium]